MTTDILDLPDWTLLAKRSDGDEYERDAAMKDAERYKDAAEMLWIVVANASGGDWTKQSSEWQEAAARWRDNYFAAIDAAMKEKP